MYSASPAYQHRLVPGLKRLLHLCGQSTRLKVLIALVRSPSQVGELATTVGVERSAVSHHLHPMLDAGLVEMEEAGQFHSYHLGANARPVRIGSAPALLVRDDQGHTIVLCVNAADFAGLGAANLPVQPLDSAETGAVSPQSPEVWRGLKELTDVCGRGIRLELLVELSAGPRHVAALAAILNLERSWVSHHLRPLLGAGLVLMSKAGHFHPYRFSPRIWPARVGSVAALIAHDLRGHTVMLCIGDSTDELWRPEIIEPTKRGSPSLHSQQSA